MPKTKAQIENELKNKYLADKTEKKPEESVADESITSREFKLFELEKVGGGEWFEKACRYVRTLNISFTISESDRLTLDNQLSLLGMDIRPEDVFVLSMLSMIFCAFVGIILFIPFGLPGLLFSFVGFLAFLYLKGYPNRLIEIRRAKASSELILAILYMVIFMRGTSNLEAAVKFVADNLDTSLSNDFKKMMWDVNSRKYAGMKEALDDYVLKWKDYSPVFVDAVHLIEASLYQAGEDTRIKMLDKSLELTLEGTFESMTRYANQLRMPINLLYMMGILLPVLTLVMFPIMGAFLADIVNPGMLITLYDIALPIGVYLFAQYSLAKRPAGFPIPDISKHPDVPPEGYFKIGKMEIQAWIPALFAFLIIIFPGIYHLIFNISARPQEVDVYYTLPIPLAPAICAYLYTKLLSKDRVKIRDRLSNIEREFAEATFQLGNRLSEGYPLEIALQKVAAVMGKSETAELFDRISRNITDLGMDVQSAVFDPNKGAIRYYPSAIVKSIMRVGIMGAKKSMDVAAVSLINMSNYLRDIHRIDEKVQDILSETLSNMKFQASFLAPVISGLVVGLTAMILIILDVLGQQVTAMTTGGGAAAGFGASTWILGIFNVSKAVPLYVFQPVVGIYVIEMIILLSSINAQIEFGGDKLFTYKLLASLIPIGMIIYVLTTFAVTVMFTGIAKIAVSSGVSFG